MTKKIVVDCCERYRHYDLSYDGEKESYFPICWNDFDGIMPKPIEDVKSIPDWCTLEDN